MNRLLKKKQSELILANSSNIYIFLEKPENIAVKKLSYYNLIYLLGKNAKFFKGSQLFYTSTNTLNLLKDSNILYCYNKKKIYFCSNLKLSYNNFSHFLISMSHYQIQILKLILLSYLKKNIILKTYHAKN